MEKLLKFSPEQLFFSTSQSRTVLSSPPDTMRLAEEESDLAGWISMEVLHWIMRVTLWLPAGND